MCHQADTAPAFLFSEQKKQVEEVLRVDPKNLNSYLFQCLHCGKHLVWMDFD